MDNYWVAKSENMGYQQFYAKDIAVIEEKGYTDKAKVGRNVFGVLSGIGLMIYYAIMFKNIPNWKWNLTVINKKQDRLNIVFVCFFIHSNPLPN